MRALQVLVVVMGVLIVAGTATVGVVIFHRLSGAGGPTGGGGGVAARVELDEPAGTRIAGMAPLGDRLALRLQGGGPDRVLLLDPRTGAILAHIALAH